MRRKSVNMQTTSADGKPFSAQFDEILVQSTLNTFPFFSYIKLNSSTKINYHHFTPK
jgi:hypothetical protein